MANVFDYLKWRDDLKLIKLNEIDVLIFNKLSYFPLENIIHDNESITISDIYKRSLNYKNFYKNKSKDHEFLKTISKSIRYKDLIINNTISKLDIEKEEQFMAITILLSSDTIFVSFRGTTEEIVAWKENFNMSYKTVPAQIDALNYVNNLPLDKKIYLGGHSKGGNLAMYAAIYAKDEIKNKIVKVYNFDGPGFIKLDENYQKMKDKMINYIPSDSIVGRLLNYDHTTVVIKSSSSGIMQHNLYSWQIEKDNFVLSNISNESNTIKNIIDEFLTKVDIPQRKQLIDSIYMIITSSGATKINDFNITVLKDFIFSYKNINDENKKLLMTIIKYLYNSTKDNIKFNL